MRTVQGYCLFVVGQTLLRLVQVHLRFAQIIVVFWIVRGGLRKFGEDCVSLCILLHLQQQFTQLEPCQLKVWMFLIDKAILATALSKLPMAL